MVEKGLSRDRAGLAALEFALVLPVLMILLSGVYDCVQLIRVNIKVNHVAQMMAKIYSQQAFGILPTDQRTLCSAVSLGLAPFSAAKLGGVMVNYSNGARSIGGNDSSGINWTVPNLCPVPGSMSDAALAQARALTTRLGDEYNIAQVTYAYQPTLLMMFGGAVTLTATSFARPRSGGGEL